MSKIHNKNAFAVKNQHLKAARCYFAKAITFTSFILVTGACDKEIQEPQREAYAPLNLDPAAGTWKTYVLTKPDEIPVEIPTAVSSPAHNSEVSELKKKSENLNVNQQAAIAYWQAGSVYRWNEIARELAAKYNLAPAADATGTYPVPNPADPLADPRFPFSNPPYTARMLATLGVAHYDALVATWHYKYKYNRVAAAKADATLKPKFILSDIPAYPSEDAVVAAASFAVLKVMFPGEIPFLKSKMDEAINVRKWGGMNVNSDLEAGNALGTAIAEKVLAKVKTDGMSAANNQAVVENQRAAAAGRGIKETWKSLEIPVRPPLLPNYGAVKTWNIDRNSLESIRPNMPYIVGSAKWQKELEELKALQKDQSREQARIAIFWADGPGSYTPPGHWNKLAADLCYEYKFSEVRIARSMALTMTAIMDAGIACWEAKYYYFTPRPQQFGLKTSIGVPNFPSYTSGHSTFSSAGATTLSYFFPNEQKALEDKAREASNSRIYGLIHFRVDCEMGLEHGKKVARFAIERGKNDGSGL